MSNSESEEGKLIETSIETSIDNTPQASTGVVELSQVSIDNTPQASTGVVELPEVSTDKIPEASTRVVELPEVSTDKIPEASTDKMPETSTDKTPEASTETHKVSPPINFKVVKAYGFAEDANPRYRNTMEVSVFCSQVYILYYRIAIYLVMVWDLTMKSLLRAFLMDTEA
jgi:hypothetical protein